MMNKTQAARTYEDVRGIVIGDMPPLYRGRLYYEGRPQSSHFRADSEAELVEMAGTIKAERLADCGTVAYLIYPNDTWELRIYE
jgi:hypothetical protein